MRCESLTGGNRFVYRSIDSTSRPEHWWWQQSPERAEMSDQPDAAKITSGSIGWKTKIVSLLISVISKSSFGAPAVFNACAVLTPPKPPQGYIRFRLLFVHGYLNLSGCIRPRTLNPAETAEIFQADFGRRNRNRFLVRKSGIKIHSQMDSSFMKQFLVMQLRDCSAIAGNFS